MKDLEILAAAIQKLGGEVRVAALCEVQPETLRVWRSRQRLPKRVRTLLLTHLGHDIELPPIQQDLWRSPRWRQARRVVKAQEQVRRLSYQTKARGRDWDLLEGLLDRLVEWKEEDWRRIADKG